MKEQILELYNAGWLPNRIAAQMQIHTKTVMDAIDGKEVTKKKAVADAVVPKITKISKKKK